MESVRADEYEDGVTTALYTVYFILYVVTTLVTTAPTMGRAQRIRWKQSRPSMNGNDDDDLRNDNTRTILLIPLIPLILLSSNATPER